MSDHHATDRVAVSVGVLTVSSSRTAADDRAGDAIVTALRDGGHAVADRDIVSDDEAAIKRTVEEFLDDDAVDAVVTTGGTGVTPDDVTIEAVRPLFDRELPGFGEQFRARSVESVGPLGMLSRATAGVSGASPVFCLPGSEDAARLGTADLVVPVLGHLVGLAGGDGEHGHDSHGDHGHDRDDYEDRDHHA